MIAQIAEKNCKKQNKQSLQNNQLIPFMKGSSNKSYRNHVYEVQSITYFTQSGKNFWFANVE